MANFFDDNEDLQFYVDHIIDWEPLVELTEFGYRSPDGFGDRTEAVEFYREVMSAVGGFAAEEIAPHAAAMDQGGVTLVDGEVALSPEADRIFEKIRGLELFGMSVPRELGGSNCPMLVSHMVSELVARADVSTMTHYGFHGGIALALLMYSIHEGTTTFDPQSGQITQTRWREAIDEMVAGRAWGAMDITEPHAGSDMAALRSRGELDDDGQWFVTGQKIFITSGHGKYHVVIARTEDDPDAGLKGLSLFLVRAYEDLPDGTRKRHGTVDRVEHKLGHHGSPTCVVSFDRSPAELIGERGEGFKLMLLLMNNARIGVGMESIGLCEAAYRMARDYAAERPSMGKTIDKHEMIADYLDEMRTDIQGLRALAIHAAYYEEMSRKSGLARKLLRDPEGLEGRRLALQSEAYARKSRAVTPLLKYLAAEKAVDMARRGVQIHGGSGYTKEYGAEKLMRDSMVLPIYEGTSQIQALMAMKDTLSGIMRNPQDFVKRVAQARWRSLSARDPIERRHARLVALGLRAQQHLIQKTVATKLRGLGGVPISKWTQSLFRNWDPKRDFAHAMLHAERLCRLMADVAVGEVLLEQTVRHDSRREVLERHLDRAEPRVRMLYDEITTTGDRLVAQLQGDQDANEKAAQ